MLKLTPTFDLQRDVVSDIFRREASVCRVPGEAFRFGQQAALSLSNCGLATGVVVML